MIFNGTQSCLIHFFLHGQLLVSSKATALEQCGAGKASCQSEADGMCSMGQNGDLCLTCSDDYDTNVPTYTKTLVHLESLI